MVKNMAKILVIDDSFITRRSIVALFDQDKYQILEASNGKLGLQMVIEEKPDLIFLDLLMPEMDGIDVLKAMKDLNIDLPVIVLSADIQTTVKNKCMQLNAFHFMNKPPIKEDLQDIVKKALELNGDKFL